MSDQKSKSIKVDEAVPVIEELDSVDAVTEYTEDDTREGIKKAAQKRVDELDQASAEAETVTVLEVDYQFLKDTHQAITEKVNDDRKQRGLSQPSSVDKAIMNVKAELDKLLK